MRFAVLFLSLFYWFLMSAHILMLLFELLKELVFESVVIVLQLRDGFFRRDDFSASRDKGLIFIIAQQLYYFFIALGLNSLVVE